MKYLLNITSCRSLFFLFVMCYCVSGFSPEVNVPIQLRCDLLLQTDYQSVHGFAVPTEWKAAMSGKHECVRILTQTPSFGWNIPCCESGATMQTAYQIIVASTEAKLKENKGDVWDSGRWRAHSHPV